VERPNVAYHLNPACHALALLVLTLLFAFPDVLMGMEQSVSGQLVKSAYLESVNLNRKLTS
jgi:hypothetical protein